MYKGFSPQRHWNQDKKKKLLLKLRQEKLYLKTLENWSTESKPCISEQAPFPAVPCCRFYDIFTSLPSPRGLYWGSCKSLGKHSHLLREKATWGPSVLYKGLAYLSLHVTIYRAAHLPQSPGHWRRPWLDLQYLSREKKFFFLLLKESKGSPTRADRCPSPGWTTSPSFMATILNWTGQAALQGQPWLLTAQQKAFHTAGLQQTLRKWTSCLTATPKQNSKGWGQRKPWNHYSALDSLLTFLILWWVRENIMMCLRTTKISMEFKKSL